MPRALAAAAVYFAIVFALAFILGVVRTLFVAPATGDVVAVIIEAPLVLLISWFAARWSAQRLSIPPEPRARLVMGLAAFALLMAVETVISAQVFDRPVAQQLAAYTAPAGAIGLLAQAAFAFMPLLAARSR